MSSCRRPLLLPGEPARPAPRQHQLAESHHATVTYVPSALLATPLTTDSLMGSPDANDSSSDGEQLSSQLRDALHLAADDAQQSASALRDVVSRYVEDGRRRGESLEVLTGGLTRLVARLRRAGTIPAAPDGPDVLVQQLVAWCMEFASTW